MPKNPPQVSGRGAAGSAGGAGSAAGAGSLGGAVLAGYGPPPAAQPAARRRPPGQSPERPGAVTARADGVGPAEPGGGAGAAPHGAGSGPHAPERAVARGRQPFAPDRRSFAPDRRSLVRDQHPRADVYARAVEDRLGASTSPEQFRRKARFIDYERMRALAEAANTPPGHDPHAPLPRMARLPRLPHVMWPAHDLGGGYYGARKGREPLHVQADPADGTVLVVNRTRRPAPAVTAAAQLYDLGGRPIGDPAVRTLDVAAGGAARAFAVPFGRRLPAAHLLRLRLTDAAGRVLSSNDYWRYRDPMDMRALNGLPQVALSLRARPTGHAGLTATVSNAGGAWAAMVQLGLVAGGSGAEADAALSAGPFDADSGTGTGTGTGAGAGAGAGTGAGTGAGPGLGVEARTRRASGAGYEAGAGPGAGGGAGAGLGQNPDRTSGAGAGASPDAAAGCVPDFPGDAAASPAAAAAWRPLSAPADDNCLWLLPGESREVALSWTADAGAPDALRVVAEAYNARRVTARLRAGS